MARILGVGNATVDIINQVEKYPAEDEEVRATAQHVVRGGNATNTLVALSQLGHQCAWAGTLADEPDAAPILSDLERYDIDTGAVHIVPRGKVPTSYVVLSQDNGSRTIVHYRDLPELTHSHFASLDLSRYDWVHFEGRNLGEVRQMMEHTRDCHPGLNCSLEVEKPRPDIEHLFPLAGTLLFSRVYAQSRGYREAALFLKELHRLCPLAMLFCGWGEGGAYAIGPEGHLLHTPAFSPPVVVDTLGAGDVFNAGVISGLVRGRALENVLIEAAKLAGHKCGQYGLGNLVVSTSANAGPLD